MIVEVTVPRFAEGATVIRLHRWQCQPGEMVEAGAQLAEAATDKIAIYIDAPASGRIVELLVEEGELVKVGQVIARIEAEPAGRRD